MIERLKNCRQGVGTVESSDILTKALRPAAAIADQSQARLGKSSSQGMLVAGIRRSHHSVQLNDSVDAPCIDWRSQTIQRQILQVYSLC